ELYPRGNLSQYLSKYQLFFGEYIQFQGATESDCKFSAIVTIKQYGKETASIMLDTLLHLDAEFISTNTFAVEEKGVAQQKAEDHGTKLENSGDKSESQIKAIKLVTDMVASDKVTLGY